MNGHVRYLVAGCGYVGRRLARALLPRGPVMGLSRSEESAAEIETQGVDALCWDLDVVDMPVTVAVDSNGISVHNTGPKEWSARIAGIPVKVE